MNRFNFTALSRFWAVAKLYWLGKEKWRALLLLGFLFLLLLVNTPLSVNLTSIQGDIITNLTKLDREGFDRTIYKYLVILIIYVPLSAGFGFVQSKLGLYWRRFLTHNFLARYFSNRSFYELSNFNTDIDNPDQRISEDIKSFTQDSLSFCLIIINSIFQIIGFTALLWTIPPKILIFTLPKAIDFSFNIPFREAPFDINIQTIEPSILVLFLIVYVSIGTLLTVGVFGKKLVQLNYQQLAKEANFRFGLVRVRENSESIAFYRGEPKERQQLKKQFKAVFNNYNSLLLWKELFLGLLTNTYENLPYILPAIVVAPSIFAGEIDVGKVTVAQSAFLRVFFSLNLIVARFEFLTYFVAGIDRLFFFHEYLEKSQLAPKKGSIIDNIENDNLEIQNLTLQTPNYKRTLINDLSLQLQSGMGLLIMGASGCGKSSLLRAIAGLWNSGTGVILRPPLSEMIFLPQKPYMVLGTLRSQLIYPETNSDLQDEELLAILKEVNLPDLADRFGGLDTEEDWGDVLSLGEQQRLAFARIFVNSPEYVILDEATSALDVENEASLYNHLKKTNTTFISVGHRPTLVKYHHQLLKLFKDRWEIIDTL